MPTPNEGESREDFVSRCIPIVLDDGTAESQDQAVAVCNSMFEQHGKSAEVAVSLDWGTDYVKITRREDVSQADRERAQSEYGNVQYADARNKKYPIDTPDHIRAAWNYIHQDRNRAKYSAEEVATIEQRIVAAWKKKIDKDGPPSKSVEVPEAETQIEEETLVYFGESVKALGNGKIGGYLVRFSTDADPDITGEFFTKDTDFGDANEGTVYYQHGMDPVLKRRKLGEASHRIDDFGVWAEAQLELRDKYEKFIYSLAEQGKLGWSSGTAPHLVEREQKGKAVYIKSWPLGLDDSLTPNPAEPRNEARPLKNISIVPLGELPMDDSPASDATPAAQDGEELKGNIKFNEDNQQEGNQMENEEKLQELIDTKVDEAVTEKIEAAVAAGVEKAMKSLPAVKDNVKVETDEADQPFPAQDFFKAVRMAAQYPGSEDPRLTPLKATGLSEGVPADGGYLLSPQVASGIIERMYQDGEVLNRVSADDIGPNSNSMLYNAVNETSRATGSRWGGLQGYWTAEGGSITASRPSFRQMELKLKKVAALCYSTDEQLADTTALASWLNRTVPNELRFLVEDAYINANGVGKPLGIMNSPCLVSVTRIDANEVDQTDIANMWSRRWSGVNDYVWFANSSVFPQLINLTVGNFPFLLPMNAGGQGDPSFSLYGRPYIETEYTAALGTTGDIMLASMSQYQTIRKGGVQAASSIHVQFLTDETAFRFIYRTDGQPLWNSPLTPFDGGSTLSPFVVLTAASA